MVIGIERQRDALTRQRRVCTRDGVALAVEVCGDARGLPVVLAHGFGQTRRSWSASAAALAAAGCRTLAYDARGHGDSDWRAGAPYAWEQMIDDLAVVAADAGPRPVLVGASMGGLVGLAAQSLRARPFRALVLVDVTPRWEAAGVERILAFMRAHPDGFASLDEASEAIASYLPHRRARGAPERLRGLLVERGDGRLRWHWDPRLLDELAAHGERYQPLLAEAARDLDVPVLLISGGASDVVSPATVDEFLALVPHARHVVVPRAAHMVAGDENDAFTREILNFLRELAAGPHAGRCAQPATDPRADAVPAPRAHD